jgi:hypothetical protein
MNHLAAETDLDDGLSWLAEQLENALERAGRRGMSPAAAARRVRRTTGTRCASADAVHALAWLTGHQYAHTTTSDRFRSGPAERTPE